MDCSSMGVALDKFKAVFNQPPCSLVPSGLLPHLLIHKPTGYSRVIDCPIF